MVLFKDTVPPPVPLVDGADPVTTGTPTDEAWYNALDASLDAQLHSATDPTATPASAITEIYNARSGEANLLTRLTAMEAAFTGVGPAAVRNGLTLANLLANDTFAMWSRGNTAAPDYWTLSGAGAAVERCGPGCTDTEMIAGQDHFAAKLTYGSAAAVLEQQVMNSGITARTYALGVNRYIPIIGGASNAPRADYDSDIDGQLNAYVIGHIHTVTAGAARLAVNDGSVDYLSPYHPGDGQWYSLIAGPLASAGSALAARCRMESAGSARFTCIGLFLTPLALPPMWLPGKVRYRHATYYVNNPASGTLTYFTFSRPAFILGAQMQCLTAGTVTAPTCDLLTPIGGVYSSLFVTLPTIATGQLVGAAQVCDPLTANYRRRTIRPALSASATQLDNTSLRLDYVDDGGGTLRDLMVTIHWLEYNRPLDQFRSVTDLGE